MKTQLIRSLQHIPPSAKGAVMTIGNFDGVHLGHQQLIKLVTEAAQTLGVPSLVMTFEPHPAEFFAPESNTVSRLTRFREKFQALKSCGIDYVLVLPFNRFTAQLSANDFVEQVLANKLSASHVIIGDDFRFGRGRMGDIELLERLGKTHGFRVSALDTYEVQAERVSSTRLRQALASGDQRLAHALLGRAYTMMGRVRPGKQLGRQLGFPTANIYLHRHVTPILGVYAVLVHGVTDKPLQGAASLGTRPTIDGTQTLLEVHLLDFNQDLYGRYVTVEFCHKLRDEERYSNLEDLKQQIAIDVEETRSYFNKIECA